MTIAVMGSKGTIASQKYDYNALYQHSTTRGIVPTQPLLFI